MSDSAQLPGGTPVATFGRHLLVEYRGCDRELLNDPARVGVAMRHAADAAGATVVAELYQPFAPHGVSGVIVIAESHLSVHTWPEQGYAAVDFYTCGECLPERAHQVLIRELGATSAEWMLVERGLEPGASLRVVALEREGPRQPAPRSRG